MDIARGGRDDARGDRAAEPERVADRQHPIADPGLGRIAPARRRQRRLGVDLEQRQIADLIAADDAGLQARIIREGDGDLLGVGDHMVVGDDQSRRIDDEARAERGRRADPVRAARSAVIAEKVVEKLIERRPRRRRQPFGRVLWQSGDAGLGRRDVDHHAQQPRRQLREDLGKRGSVAAGRPGPAPPPAASSSAVSECRPHRVPRRPDQIVTRAACSFTPRTARRHGGIAAALERGSSAGVPAALDMKWRLTWQDGSVR